MLCQTILEHGQGEGKTSCKAEGDSANWKTEKWLRKLMKEEEGKRKQRYVGDTGNKIIWRAVAYGERKFWDTLGTITLR